MMIPKLLLVDYENRQKIDLSLLDESYRAIIFVGAQQSPPKAAKLAATSHRFQRVDFQKIDGNGKNALDFHIAFQLGRTYETVPETECFILSGDKGFDPLVTYLNRIGLKCERLETMDALVSDEVNTATIAPVVCRRCNRSSTIEHHGGRWCTNCGCFAAPPDPTLLPSNSSTYRHTRENHSDRDRRESPITTVCGWCNQRGDMSGGIYDDGEWMCGNCIARYSD